MGANRCPYAEFPGWGNSGGYEFPVSAHIRSDGCQLFGVQFTRLWERSVKGSVIYV